MLFPLYCDLDIIMYWMMMHLFLQAWRGTQFATIFKVVALTFKIHITNNGIVITIILWRIL